MIQTTTSLNHFKQTLTANSKSYLLIYKKGVGVSDCAYSSVEKAAEKVKSIKIFSADANETRDIHPAYNITSAPSLLVFENGNLKDVVKGCHDETFYKNLFENALFSAKAAEHHLQKTVTVYSTPTCPWCTTLKNFLRKNGIQFTDIDVSRDQDAARTMVSATGQQGVPQANIGGEWVVGFDQLKIKRLLNIQS